MNSNREESSRVHEGDDGSGRIALFGLLLVVSLLVAAVKLNAQDIPGASPSAKLSHEETLQ